MRLRGAIPALPARDVAATAAFYRDRLGFTVAYQTAGFARMVRDDAEVQHYADPGGPTDTDFGTREFAVTDLDNNLIVFFRRT